MGVYHYTPIFSIMGIAKYKRGEDYIDLNVFQNTANAGWNTYLSDYDFGKNIDQNKMNEMLNYILTGIGNGSIIYNPTTGNTYSFTLNGDKPELDFTTPEGKYTIGYLGDLLRNAEAIQEDPWNANTYYSDLLKQKYWKGQEANNDLLSALPQDQKVSTYKTMIDIFKSGIDGIPEDQREDYLNFWNRASGFMDNDQIDPDELNDLYRYTGQTFNWLQTPKPKVKETPIAPAEVKKEERPVTPKVEDKKEPKYDKHFDIPTILDNEKSVNYYKEVSDLNEQEYSNILKKALNNPNQVGDYLPYILLRKVKESKQTDGYVDLGLTSSNYKYFIDLKNNQVVKSHKANFANYKNVETPNPTDKEETKPETQA